MSCDDDPSTGQAPPVPPVAPAPPDAAWFGQRLPPKAELDALLAGDVVAEMLQLSGTRAPVVLGFDGDAPADADPEVAAQLQLAKQAAAKLGENAEAELSDAEVEAMHAFVHLVARPSLAVVDGRTPGIPVPWKALDSAHAFVRRRLDGVGRLDRHDGATCGTGWFVTPELLVTNRHVVAALLSIPLAGNWKGELADAKDAANATWRQSPGARPVWDPGDAPPTDGGVQGRVTEIVGLHPVHDLALLAVEGVADAEDRVLRISAEAPDPIDGAEVYVPGYPVVGSGLGLHPALLKILFGGPSATVVKRLAPGRLMKLDGNKLRHDATTLGGSSGSPMLSLSSHRAVGLHYSGAYAKRNSAVPLWTLGDDPLLQDHGIEVS